MIALEPHAEGTILPVQARAVARRNALKLAPDGSLQISVTQAPEKGKANKAIIALVAAALSLRKSQIELLSGATSPQKRFLVREMALEDLAARVQKAVES